MSTNSVRRTLDPIVVQTKTNWADAWVDAPNVEPISATISAGRHGTMRFRVRYGVIKWPASNATTTVTYTAIARDWIRVTHAGNVLWMGRVEADSRTLHGNNGTNSAGVQIFTAYDGTRILEKMYVAKTATNDTRTGTEATPALDIFDGVANPNGTDANKTLDKNRSKNKLTGYGADHYIFESRDDRDAQLWTAKDYLEYIFQEHLLQNNITTQPEWTISGQLANLDFELQQFEIPEEPQTILWHISQCVQKRFGWNFAVVPTTTGFDLRVFSMSNTGVTYGSFTLPANPYSFSLNPTSAGDMANTLIETSQVESHGRIELSGNRMIVCCSPEHQPTVTDAAHRATPDIDHLIRRGWKPSEELAYVEADLITDPILADEYRESAEFDDVFQNWVLRKEITKDICPTFNNDGTLDTTASSVTKLDLENESILSWIPMKAGFNYQVDPPLHLDGSELSDKKWVNKEFLTPWFFYETKEDDPDTATTDLELTGDFVESSRIGYSSYINEGGLSFKLSHNVINHYGSGGYSEAQSGLILTQPTLVETYAQLKACTIAFRSQTRMKLIYEKAGYTPQDGIRYFHDESAEFIYLAPNTIMGLKNRRFVRSKSTGIVLRNDLPNLERVMAGLIQRYVEDRLLARVEAFGVYYWGQKLGYILEALGDGATGANNIGGPVTEVRWQFEREQKTEISSGL